MKLLRIVLGSIFTTIVIYLIAINAVQLLIIKEPAISFDYRLLFFQGNSQLFMVVNVIVGLFIFGLIIAELSSSKRKKDNDYKNFSKLASVYEAKRGLVRIQFKDGHIRSCTFFDLYDKLTNPIKKFLNYMMYLFKVPDRHRFNVIKKFKNDGKLVTKGAGVPIYTPRFFKNRFYVDASDCHNLFIGTTRSGKSFFKLLQMIETIRMCGECAVINDPKGELYGYTAKAFKDDGYEVIRLDFTNPDISDSWNPLDYAWEMWKSSDEAYEKEYKKWKEKLANLTGKELKEHMLLEPNVDHSDAIEYLVDTARILAQTSNADSDNAFWDEAAADVISGLSSFLMEEGKDEWINFKNIALLNDSAIEELDPVLKKELEVNAKSLLGAYLELKRKKDDFSSMKLENYLTSAENTKKSTRSVVANKLRILTLNDKIMRMTSKTSFDMKKLGHKKMVIYLVVHDEKSTYYPLVTLFMKQLYEMQINKVRNQAGRLPIPVNVLIDEAGNCPPFSDIGTMLTAGASRGFRFTLVFQDLSQMREKYGKELAETIQNNCMNIVYILGSQEETLKEISEMCGHYMVWLPARQMYESRPLLSTDRLRKLNEGEVVYIRQRKNAFITRMVPYNKYKDFYNREKLVLETKAKPKVSFMDLEMQVRMLKK